MSSLEKLGKMTVVVADTGDFFAMKKHKPRDATTNPSLLLAAAKMPEYREILKKTIKECGISAGQDMRPLLERLSVNFGKEILAIVPGRVSVEIDAGLSFNVKGTIEAARRLIALFEKEGIERSRILIKIAATWEGICAAGFLEKEGISCNLTLLFSFVQAVACAEAGVQLISPFVGRILDWYKKEWAVEHIPPEEDPGVLSVKKIYNYYKHFDYKTEIMGASFRNSGEIRELAGCDLLTISPQLLEELAQDDRDLPRKLDPEKAKAMQIERLNVDEIKFRWLLNEDAMATEKLAEGIRRFSADLQKLTLFLQDML